MCVCVCMGFRLGRMTVCRNAYMYICITDVGEWIFALDSRGIKQIRTLFRSNTTTIFRRSIYKLDGSYGLFLLENIWWKTAKKCVCATKDLSDRFEKPFQPWIHTLIWNCEVVCDQNSSGMFRSLWIGVAGGCSSKTHKQIY